ncbi:adenylyl-sulfate kinase [Acidithiobacillus sp.]|uniref:adenylyl-sulfate kinase n=1 Tax=Acidithiobacillus sp. TaxID=1872118 RepID=UPI003D071913
MLNVAIESDAETLEGIIAETLKARTAERQGRFIDSDMSGSMGNEKTRRVFLMRHDKASSTLLAQDEKETLRFITCGPVPGRACWPKIGYREVTASTPGEFLEVFIDAPLAERERRDVKGLNA